MAVLTLSSRSKPEPQPEDFEQFAVTLSARLAHLHVEAMPSAIAVALSQLAAAVSANTCRLIELSDAGTIATQYVGGAADHGGERPSQPAADDRWLIERLARGETVLIQRIEELPGEALAAREHARRTGNCSVMGWPASVGGQVVSALVIEGASDPRGWPAPLVGRLQLIADILGLAVQRCRHDTALRGSVADIERMNSRLEAENVCLKEEIKSYHDFDDIVGESPALRIALSRLGQVAPMNSTVLLLGPTGTGKELFARALHERSRRHARALVRVNCAALPASLVESELFGHEKGAFTGAVATRQGRFELADGGTIFLDEIGDLPPDIQVKFLRVLQEGEFERVGSSRTRRVDVRVIAATHLDLEAAVADGRFRADLYYRLSVYPIHLPSLQQRTEDIPRLVWFFIHRLQGELGRRITKVPQSVMDALQQYSWPGNVRELENVVERAMIASNGETLQLDDTPGFGRVGAARPAVSDNLDAVQCAHIEAVLARCSWRINGSGNAAERLGVHPNTLRFRMKKLGVVCPEGRTRRTALRQ